MNSKFSHVWSRSAFVALSQILFAVVMAGAVPAFAADQGKDSQHLQGAWIMDFSVPPNGFLPEHFQLLTNFTVDGGVVATSNLPNLPVVPLPFPFTVREGTGHGEWARTGRGTFIVDVWRPTTCVHPTGCTIPETPIDVLTGDFVGWARGKAEIRLDGRTDTMEGIIQLQLFAPDRVTPLLPPLPGALTGERLRPHPIEP